MSSMPKMPPGSPAKKQPAPPQPLGIPVPKFGAPKMMQGALPPKIVKHPPKKAPPKPTGAPKMQPKNLFGGAQRTGEVPTALAINLAAGLGLMGVSLWVSDNYGQIFRAGQNGNFAVFELHIGPRHNERIEPLENIVIDGINTTGLITYAKPGEAPAEARGITGGEPKVIKNTILRKMREICKLTRNLGSISDQLAAAYGGQDSEGAANEIVNAVGTVIGQAADKILPGSSIAVDIAFGGLANSVQNAINASECSKIVSAVLALKKGAMAQVKKLNLPADAKKRATALVSMMYSDENADVTELQKRLTAVLSGKPDPEADKGISEALKKAIADEKAAKALTPAQQLEQDRQHKERERIATINKLAAERRARGGGKSDDEREDERLAAELAEIMENDSEVKRHRRIMNILAISESVGPGVIEALRETAPGKISEEEELEMLTATQQQGRRGAVRLPPRGGRAAAKKAKKTYGSEVQSVHFPRSDWDAQTARRWLASHMFKMDKMDKTNHVIMFRQANPDKFSRFITKEIVSGDSPIKMIIGFA